MKKVKARHWKAVLGSYQVGVKANNANRRGSVPRGMAIGCTSRPEAPTKQILGAPKIAIGERIGDGDVIRFRK